MFWRKVSTGGQQKLKNLDEVEQTYAEIIEKGQCVSLKELAVTGRDPGYRAGNEAGKRDRGKVKRIIEPCDRESGNEYQRDPAEI